MKICAIVPTYNHAQTIAYVVSSLRAHNLKVFIIDDGSSEIYREAIAGLQTDDKGVEVFRLPENQGKGSAVKEGFRLAYATGYTHALQIDADGQHDIQSIPQLLSMAYEYPNALITGVPIYDESAPLGRKIGRWITHVWVWVETLSFSIKDSMCGFRVYPLRPVIQLMENQGIGDHMDFDTDIMVRLYWNGVDVKSIPVKVIYPIDNTSNFAMWKDNVRISWMHTKLVFSMLRNLWGVVRRKNATKEVHWASMQERGTYYGLAFCSASYRLLGKRISKLIFSTIAFYFFVFGRTQRNSIDKFLTKALKRKPTWVECYQNFRQFSFKALDVISAWQKDFSKDNIHALTPDSIQQLMGERAGALLIVSHLGNADFSRAILTDEMRERLTLLVHSKNAVSYNKALEKICPDALMNMLQITDIDPHTIMNLQDKIAKGAYICIAGDRTPTNGENASVVDFIGAPARFAQGPWVLASLLKCPVYLLFCPANEAGQYSLSIEKFADQITLGRTDRHAALTAYCQSYATRLEHYAVHSPFQWFNFYDFWELKK